MKLATRDNGTADGALMVVAQDQQSWANAETVAPNLRTALESWAKVEPELQALYRALNTGTVAHAQPFDSAQCLAPLPRTFQWCDASAFLNHGKLMEKAFNTKPIPHFDTIPVMYQGAGDDFLGPHVDVPIPDESLGIDFEGEFGVIVDRVPMGTAPADAAQRICLLVQLNDWSLRHLGPHEMATGFGFLQAKPATSFAPIAITPDELGEHWQADRVHLHLNVQWNGQWFGNPNGREMNFSFSELVSHAARTRNLSPGTIIGSGTVSNQDRSVGSACISERRVLEILDNGKPATQFIRSGDRVRMEACFPDGTSGPFGVIDQQVIVR